MLASAAILAGVIGIAARAPIANLVSGIMIAFSQPVRLNDYISVDEVFGTVEQISLIYTCIRTADGRRVVIPNEAFANKAVHNFSMGSPEGKRDSVDITDIGQTTPVDTGIDIKNSSGTFFFDDLDVQTERGPSVEARLGRELVMPE